MSQESFDEGRPSSSVPDLTNTCIGIENERLVLEQVIGRGTWGVVYRARDVNNPELVYAVKTISFGSMTPEQRGCIDHEIILQSACADASDCVLKVDRVYEDKDRGLLFIVTELCAGDLLSCIQNMVYAGNTERIKQTFFQILNGLEACHKLGVYHRDLKPENIMVKNDLQVTVGDFGFATTEASTCDFQLGSWPYMSPEVLGGIDTELSSVSSPDSDVWALGVIFMALITGHLPWNEATLNDVHFWDYLNDPDSLYRKFPISKDANEILKSIFTVDPGQQRTSIEDLRKRVSEAETFGRETSDEGVVLMSQPKIVSRKVLSEADMSIVVHAEFVVSEFVNEVNFPTSISSNFAPFVNELSADVAGVSAAESVYDPSELIIEPVFVISDDSDTESEGPITPETHAVDADAAAAPAESAIFTSTFGEGVFGLDNMMEFDLADASPIVIEEGVGAARAGRKHKTALQTFIQSQPYSMGLFPENGLL